MADNTFQLIQVEGLYASYCLGLARLWPTAVKTTRILQAVGRKARGGKEVASLDSGGG